MAPVVLLTPDPTVPGPRRLHLAPFGVSDGLADAASDVADACTVCPGSTGSPVLTGCAVLTQPGLMRINYWLTEALKN